MREKRVPVLLPATVKTTFFIKTFGCQMNMADSERMTVLLSEQGYQAVEQPEEADFILLNGCTVREKAVHKALSSLGKFRKLTQAPSHQRRTYIGVGGCVGQLDREKLFLQAPVIDFVFGTDAIDQLPEILYRVQQGERKVVVAEFDPSLSYSTETKLDQQKVSAFVNIMKGCDKYCTYCIVPFTRGREKSRTIAEVVDDVARLVAQGVREVTLLGQNVNSFGKGNANVARREPYELNSPLGKVGPRAGEENFPQLLYSLDCDPRCADLKRIRFTSSHPLDFSDELVQCYASPLQGGVKRLAASLHLPIQSGSNRVLQKMGRHHTVETYIAQMDHLREISPQVGISTDLIVGFPGETEEDFQATLRLLDRVRYDHIYAFCYSPRPGTRAALRVDDVSDAVKKERLQTLLAHQTGLAEQQFAERVGQRLEVLVEGLAKNQKLAGLPPEASSGVPRVWMGRTSCFRVVNFLAPATRNWAGQWVWLNIVGASGLSLEGKVEVDDSAVSL